MLWQYKLDKNFNLTIGENRSLLSSMTVKICFKMMMKSLVGHCLTTMLVNCVFNWRLTKIEVGLFYNNVFK